MVEHVDSELSDLTSSFRSLTMRDNTDLSGYDVTENADLSIDIGPSVMAVLADLGRLRQEELPLSDIERRGPSFAPSDRNTISHHLSGIIGQGKWEVSISDEESEGVDGLANIDPRPYAKKTAATFIKNDTVPFASTAKTTYCVKTSSLRSSSNEVVGRLGGLVPPGGQPVMMKPHCPKIRSHPGSAPDYILCRGACEVKGPQANFTAEFFMKVKTLTNCGYLVLCAPNKADRVHDVLELEPPVLEDGYCRITSSSHHGGSTDYRVKLSSPDLTKKFKTYLEILRLAAGIQPSASAVQGVSADGRSMKTQTHQARVQADYQAGAETQAHSTQTHPLDEGISDDESILTEDSTEKYHNLIDRILPEITMGRGSLRFQSEEIKAEVQELLRLFTRIRSKAAPRVQYTSAQIQGFRAESSPRPERLEAASFPVKPSPEATEQLAPDTPKRPLSVTSNPEFKGLLASRWAS